MKPLSSVWVHEGDVVSDSTMLFRWWWWWWWCRCRSRWDEWRRGLGSSRNGIWTGDRMRMIADWTGKGMRMESSITMVRYDGSRSRSRRTRMRTRTRSGSRNRNRVGIGLQCPLKNMNGVRKRSSESPVTLRGGQSSHGNCWGGRYKPRPLPRRLRDRRRRPTIPITCSSSNPSAARSRSARSTSRMPMNYPRPGISPSNTVAPLCGQGRRHGKGNGTSTSAIGLRLTSTTRRCRQAESRY